MGRNLSRLLGQFLVIAARGMGYAAILAISVLSGVVKGLWDSSARAANGWRLYTAGLGIDSHLEDPMYWLMRIMAFLLSFAVLSIADHIITRIVIEILSWIWWRLP